MRANSTLAKLTSDQLDEIFDQIDSGVSLRDVQKFCEAAPPDGFGVRIHLITLSRFYRAERAHRHAEELAQARFNDADSADPEQLMRHVRIELAHACYDLAHHPGQSATVNSLSRITHRLEVLKLEQQRIKIDENRLALERDSSPKKSANSTSTPPKKPPSTPTKSSPSSPTNPSIWKPKSGKSAKPSSAPRLLSRQITNNQYNQFAIVTYQLPTMNFKSLHTTIGGDPVCQLFNQTLEQLDLSPDTRFETFNQKSFEPQNSSC